MIQAVEQAAEMPRAVAACGYGYGCRWGAAGESAGESVRENE